MSTRRRRADVALVLVLVAACTSGQAATTTTTTTTPRTGPAAESTTTTTEVGAVSSSGFVTRRQGVLIVGTERTEPPWFTTSVGGEITGGFDYAVAQEIGSRLGVPIVKVVKSSLVHMMTGQDCRCDVMLGAITITDGRARTLDLTEPYAPSDQAVLVRSDTVVATIAQARLLRWAVELRNTVGVGLVRDRIQPATPASIVVHEDDALRLLSTGAVDAVLVDLPQALAVVAENQALAVAGQIRTGDQYAMALSLGSPNTALVNDVIRDMRDDRILDALFQTYLGVTPAEVPELSS